MADDTNANLRGFDTDAAVSDHRLNNASSCIGCHIDGMNRANDNMRGWLDEGGKQFPKGEYSADPWLKDPETVAKVRELYPPSSVMRVKMENDRRVFLNAMAQIKQAMVAPELAKSSWCPPPPLRGRPPPGGQAPIFAARSSMSPETTSKSPGLASSAWRVGPYSFGR